MLNIDIIKRIEYGKEVTVCFFQVFFFITRKQGQRLHPRILRSRTGLCRFHNTKKGNSMLRIGWIIYRWQFFHQHQPGGKFLV